MNQDTSIKVNAGRYLYEGDFCIDTLTGERLDTVTVTAPVGTSVRTPAQQDAYKKVQALNDYKQRRKSNQKELGNFYFASTENDFKKLTPETAARLIYLCTYLDFDNSLKWKRRNMKKSDLQELLGVSRGTAFKFWKEVSPLYLVEDAAGLKLVNSDFIRGSIKSSNKSYQKFFINFVRKLYESTDTTRHRHLGYVFGVLPYVNIEYNVLCWNPCEKVLEDINSLSLSEFCDLIGCYKDDVKSLMDKYEQITFPVNGQQEYFLSYVVHNSDFDGARLFVNPKIFYAGSDYRKVEILGAFTKKEKRVNSSDYLEHTESA